MSASSINKIMGVGTESLFNARTGVDVTGSNISNAHTEGYSRQIVETESRRPQQHGRLVLGSGAEIQTIRRAHDSYIEKQLGQEMQNNGRFESLATGLQSVEEIFSPELTSTIQERADQFINALREFSNYPEELPVRVSLADTGAKLAESFNTTIQNVSQVQENLTAEVKQNIAEINMQLGEVAKLNIEISSLSASSKNPPNDLFDRRDKIIRELSEKMDIKTYQDKQNKVILRGPGDSLLVEGAQSAKLDVRQTDGRIQPEVFVSGLKGDSWQNINGKFDRGKIAGLLQARDVYAQRVRNQVNEFAREFAGEFNRIHQMGHGIGSYAESAGRPFFIVADGNDNPAETIQLSQVVLTEPEAIAGAMSPNAPGDNIIGNEMIRFFEEKRFADGRMSFGNVYEDIIGHLGTDVRQAVDEKSASDIVLAQIKENKEAIAGVSLDEEAQNMMKYQNAFNASSKLITTADDMMQTIIGLKR